MKPSRPWWAIDLPLPDGWTPPGPRVVNVKFSPTGYVRAANELAHEFAKEPALRVLAAQVCRTVQDIHAEAPLAIAAWIRKHITYMQEAGEVIQGPYHTLTTRVGDCDDLVTLWACLCRSIGVPAVLVGLCRPGERKPQFAHAVGMAGGRLYELTDDRRYTMAGDSAPILMRWPANTWGWYWQPTSRKGRWMGDLSALSGQLEQLGNDDFVREGLDNIPLPDVLKRGVAAATSAAAAGSSAAGAAAALGISASAVPIIGWVVGGAALLGVGIGALAARVKQKRSVLQLGNQVAQWVDATVAMLEPGVSEARVRALVLELVPVMAGVEGARDRRKRTKGTVTIASLTDRSAPQGATWIDGSTGRKRGVAAAVGTKGQAERILRQMRTTARTFAEGLATLDLVARRRAVNLAVESFLGLPPVFAGADVATATRPQGLSEQQQRLGPIAPMQRPMLERAPQIRADTSAPVPIGAIVAATAVVGALIWRSRQM